MPGVVMITDGNVGSLGARTATVSDGMNFQWEQFRGADIAHAAFSLLGNTVKSLPGSAIAEDPRETMTLVASSTTDRMLQSYLGTAGGKCM